MTRQEKAIRNEAMRKYKAQGRTGQEVAERCDYDDYSRSESGAFIAGNNYPSIDHVVPISNGGKHSWDNVRLAHRICNVKIYAEQRNA